MKMELPDIWGQGSLFCFSGLDGENSFNNNFAGTLAEDKLGIIFHTKARRELSLDLKGICNIDYDIVASDIIKGKFSIRNTNEVLPFAIVFYSQDIVLGFSSSFSAPVVHCEHEQGKGCNGDMCIHGAKGEYTALIREKREGHVYFAFSYSDVSEYEAVTKAKKGLKTDINRIIEEKLDYFKKLPKAAGVNGRIEKTLYKCFSVMKSQVYSPQGLFKTFWTTPDRLPHKRLWLWDSVFHSFGNRHISVDLAYQSIQAVFAAQAKDGFIPHMAAPPNKYSNITQPPVLAWGLYDLYVFSKNKDFLKENYTSLKKYLFWNMKNRDMNKNHLYEWEIEKESTTCRCGECGMDNSPRFDDVVRMDCIDFSCFMANEARHMAKIAKLLGMQNEQEYWSGLFEKIKNAVNSKLWDEEDKFYYDRIISDNKLKKVKAVSSFLPLFAGVCEKYHADFLVKHLADKNSFYTKFPVPSISVDEPAYCTDMWRGPVWINYNYMLIKGLREYGYIKMADEIKNKTIDTISFWYEHDGCVYEFYDSLNRVSPSRLDRKGPCAGSYDFWKKIQCIRDYGWTCAVYADLVLERDFK